MIAKNLGFNGKSLIHPRQIKPLHQAYAPTRQELAEQGASSRRPKRRRRRAWA